MYTKVLFSSTLNPSVVGDCTSYFIKILDNLSGHPMIPTTWVTSRPFERFATWGALQRHEESTRLDKSSWAQGLLPRSVCFIKPSSSRECHLGNRTSRQGNLTLQVNQWSSASLIDVKYLWFEVLKVIEALPQEVVIRSSTLFIKSYFWYEIPHTSGESMTNHFTYLSPRIQPNHC